MSVKPEDNKIPEEFPKIIRDFVSDIKITFPEFKDLIEKWWKDESFFNYIEDTEERKKAYSEAEKKSIQFLFDFCQKKFPSRFFEILYQNEDMFKDDSSSDTEFLPHIHFKTLWKLDISKKTRETIWKYLQLILFCIIGTIENREAFGDTAKLFEAINADDFKDKLQETLSKMQNLFNMSDKEGEGDDCPDLNEHINMDNLPKADDINEHISGLLDGKLGKLAKEIAEETAAGLNLDLDGVTDMKDVFNKLIKNPTKLMSLVKDVGGKLDSRIKSGEIKESELMAEASELMNKMKNMPGMENIQSMLNKMGMGHMAGNMGGGKMNTGAMQAQLNKNMKSAQMRERMKAKAEANIKMKEQMAQESLKVPVQAPMQAHALTEEQLNSIFTSGDKAERTPRGSKPSNNNNNKKKKKGKK